MSINEFGLAEDYRKEYFKSLFEHLEKVGITDPFVKKSINLIKRLLWAVIVLQVGLIIFVLRLINIMGVECEIV